MSHNQPNFAVCAKVMRMSASPDAPVRSIDPWDAEHVRAWLLPETGVLIDGRWLPGGEGTFPDDNPAWLRTLDRLGLGFDS